MAQLEKAAEPEPLSRLQNVQMPSDSASEEMLRPPNMPSRDHTYLDQHSKVQGKLTFEAPLQIDGQIEGEIDAHDTTLMIGKSAMVTAKIKAISVIVAGVVNGEISASQRIELQPSARVSGNLTAPKLIVQEGAMFEGNCTMQPKAVREDRNKPEASRKEERPPAVNIELSGRA